jgi:uncharacterized protein with GYD domain
MPEYIILGQYTQEGIKNIKDAPKRLENAKKLMESLGGKLKVFYHTLGRYDFVAITETVDLNNALKAAMMIGGIGAVRTETLVAFPAEKGAEIIKSIP